MQCLLLRPPDDQVAHHIRTRLRNGAAASVECCILDHTVLNRKLQIDIVSAARVHAVQHDRRILQIVLVRRMKIMFIYNFTI